MKGKRSLLSKISDEVGELHPLLQWLFEKLDGIDNVEYTHGTREYGADFVLGREDVIVGSREHIGVIVKVGSINQSMMDVERQIDECMIPRKYNGGKNEIRLDEIWVVTNGNISKGAQDKIYEKYKSTKVKFISGNRLGDLINKYLPEYWEDTSAVAGKYLSEIRTKLAEQDKRLSMLPGLEDIYVEPDVVKIISKKGGIVRSRKANIYESIESSLDRFIIIEGGAGSGKSKLLRRIAQNYSDTNVFSEKGILPIIVDYKEFNDVYDCDINKYVDENVYDFRSDTDVRGVLFMIDGADEKKADLGDLLASIDKMAKYVEGNKKYTLLLTSRFIRGYEINIDDDVVTRMELKPLSMSKVIAFIKSICPIRSLSERIVEDLKRSPLYKNLPQSPIVAIILGQLINENPNDLPSSLTELYSKFVELMIGRWDMDKGLQSQKEYEATKVILCNIAIYMMENELPSISLEEAREFYRNYFRNRNMGIEPDYLFKINSDRVNLIDIDADSNVFRFKHRTVTEFLYALSGARNIDNNLEEIAFVPYWVNSVFFSLGLSKDDPHKLDRLFKFSSDSEVDKWMKIFTLPEYMLAAYATPYDVINTGVETVLFEAARVYIDLSQGKKESLFKDATRMQILFFMKFIMEQNMSYNFFKNALEDAAMRIHDSAVDNLVKSVALYLCFVSYISAGGKEPIEKFFDEKESLPLEIRLTMYEMYSKSKDKSLLLKKQNRYVQRLLRSGGGARRIIDDLYKKPIHEIGS